MLEPDRPGTVHFPRDFTLLHSSTATAFVLSGLMLIVKPLAFNISLSFPAYYCSYPSSSFTSREPKMGQLTTKKKNQHIWYVAIHRH